MVSDGEYVFAYGSLVRDLAAVAEPRPARLRGHRRAWNVAMDNELTLPGYKYYLDALEGSRPRVHVTFLNLLATPGHAVNGMLVPVEGERLLALDQRERNYERREVTKLVEEAAEARLPPGGWAAPRRIWTYFGGAEACQRFADGRRSGRIVVDKAYLESVRAGFAALAPDWLAEFERTTEPHGCRVLELTRVEVD